MKKLKGFTLSEILIAMLVLGIIVAASVPIILNLTPNKNAIMMKKAYYATESIIHSLINSHYYPDQSSNCNGQASWSGRDGCWYGFDDTTNVTLPGNVTTTPMYKLQCLFAYKLNIKEDLASVCSGTITTVNTLDGMTWNLAALSNAFANGYLEIDVDGINKGEHAYYLTTGKGYCDNKETWSPNSCDNELTNKHKKTFDRIQITISVDGKLTIDQQQEEFINILNGTKKLMGDDEEK